MGNLLQTRTYVAAVERMAYNTACAAVSATAATVRARGVWGEAGNLTVNRARAHVANLGFTQVVAGHATQVRSTENGTGTYCAPSLTAGKRASTPVCPSRKLAINGAGVGVADLGLLLRPACCATVGSQSLD